MYKNTRGFTLTELLVVLVVLGVVAGLAVPAYFSTVESGRDGEARTNLNILLMAEKLYKVNNSTFWCCGNNAAQGGTDTINSTLNTDIAVGHYFTTAVTTGDATNFKAVATRNGVEGGDGTRCFSINQNGTLTGPQAGGC